MKKTVVWAICLIVWMGVIFAFSAQDAAESSHLSGEIVSVLIKQFGNGASAGGSAESFRSMLVFIVRKAAHFTEYMILGFFAYHTINSAILSGFLKSCEFMKKKRYLVLSVTVFCMLYSFTDEFHQMFVDGRAAMITDCVIDTLGSFCMALICMIASSLYHKIIKTLKKT